MLFYLLSNLAKYKNYLSFSLSFLNICGLIKIGTEKNVPVNAFQTLGIEFLSVFKKSAISRFTGFLNKDLFYNIFKA
nr:MAG TPA: hypothetical protein [Caudoviricetes sp.]